MAAPSSVIRLMFLWYQSPRKRSHTWKTKICNVTNLNSSSATLYTRPRGTYLRNVMLNTTRCSRSSEWRTGSPIGWPQKNVWPSPTLFTKFLHNHCWALSWPERMTVCAWTCCCERSPALELSNYTSLPSYSLGVGRRHGSHQVSAGPPSWRL